MKAQAHFVFIYLICGLLSLLTPAIGSVALDKAELKNQSTITFNVGSKSLTSTGNAIEVGTSKESILWTATPGGSVVDTDAAFNGRGYWRSFERKGFCTTNIADTCTAVFEFKTFTVSAVGAFMNYTTDWPKTPSGIWIEALGKDGSVLESYNLFRDAPIPGTQYLDNGAFRGIIRNQNDIAAFRVRTDGGFFALDDLTFARLNIGEAVNISCRAPLEKGALLNPGFVIAKNPAKVLIRAVGPGLGDFSVPDPMADPQLKVFSGQSVIAANDDWHTPQADMAAASANDFLSVGAFPLKPGSKDAALVMELLPGAYTVQAGGKDSNASGEVLVEVYIIQ